MPFSDSFARRMIVGDFDAISRATRKASSRKPARGTTDSTEPYACNSPAVAVAPVYTIARIRCCGTRRAR